VPSAGQGEKSADYHARGPGFGFFFEKRKAVLAFVRGDREQTLELRFLGASKSARLEADQRRSGLVHRIQGAKQGSLPTYRRLIYRGLWPGIDMVVRGSGGALKYEFHVHPGAAARDIRIGYRGIEKLAVGNGGVLFIDTALGVLTDARPVSYQRVGSKRVLVESRYRIAERGRSYGFDVLGHYDKHRPLVIDPSLAYSTYLGGSRNAFLTNTNDLAYNIAIGDDGSAYVVGETVSADFPTTPGAHRISFTDDREAFVTKISPDGSELVYSTYLGGTQQDLGIGIAVDRSGSAYVVGTTTSPDYPTTENALDQTCCGETWDGFVTKLNPQGSSLIYSTYLGGSLFDQARGIVVGEDGAAHVVGLTESRDFPTTGGGDAQIGGNEDAFVTKLSAEGSQMLYSTYLGGSSNEVGFGIALGSSGNAYVAGATSSRDFPTTTGAWDATRGGTQDAFATRLSPEGSLVYSTYLGGSLEDEVLGIAVDAAGSAYLTGTTTSADFPTTAGKHDATLDGRFDAFVSKLNSEGTRLSYSTYLGGSFDEFGQSVAVDAQGRAYITGFTDSPDFPTTDDALDSSFNGPPGIFEGDAFLTRLSRSGSSLSYSTFLGGTQADHGSGVALDKAGNPYVAGFTRSEDFPVTEGSYDRTHNGGDDAFISKIAFNNPPSCGGVAADPSVLWPPNRSFRLVGLSGAIDPDGDPVELSVRRVVQDEPVTGVGDRRSPDALPGVTPHTVRLRAERSPRGDGRVYRIGFTATDDKGASCSGETAVAVPRRPHQAAQDSSPPEYSSFAD
jgi:hypothetical protein